VVVVKIVGTGFRHKYFRYAARAGCHSVRREDVKRLKDRERENATLKRFLADAEWIPTIRIRRCGPGCATTPRAIRDEVSARVSRRPHRRLVNQS
jgi:hypothetical protein